jgi:hypothetical protein
LIFFVSINKPSSKMADLDDLDDELCATILANLATRPTKRPASRPPAKVATRTLPKKRMIADQSTFSDAITAILRSWLYAHASTPYPSDIEKQNLMDATGLTFTQLNNWLSNARRRILKKSYSRPSSKRFNIPAKKLSKRPIKRTKCDYDDSTSFEY